VTNRIPASDGCELNIRILRTTPSPATPILFIHALAMNGDMWGEVAARLAVDAPMAALDCRGHGASGKPAGPYQIDRFAHDVRDVLDALGWERAIVVGCSMGGTVAQGFAGSFPQRCAGLVLVDTTCWYGENAAAAWAARAAKAQSEGLPALVPFQTERWLSADFSARHPEVLRRALDVFLANDVPAYVASCRMLGAADERERIARYRGPADVIVGEADQATPLAMAEDLARRLRGANLTVIPRTRHFTVLEAPDEVAERIAALHARAV